MKWTKGSKNTFYYMYFEISIGFAWTLKEGDAMKKYLERLKNPATIIGISGYMLTILTALGVGVDNDAVMTVVQSICAICVLLGIMNNPETSGIDIPKKSK